MLNRLSRLPQNSVYDRMESPIGPLWIIASSAGLHAVLMRGDQDENQIKKIIAKLPRDPRNTIVQEACKQLREYFAGQRRMFDLPIKFFGTTFQERAWHQLRKIPYGKTMSYSDQARHLGDIKKTRAVGTANGRNLISIIVPCHRVIGKNGSLTGFAGGLENKKWLLNLERESLL